MTSTAFKEAFRKAGYLVEGRNIEQIFDASRLTDIEVIERLKGDRLSVEDITRQLQDNKAEALDVGAYTEEAQKWRGRAMKARRALQATIDVLEEEARKRGLVAALVTPAEAAKIASLAIRQNLEEQARLEKEKRTEERRIKHEALLAEQAARKAERRGSNMLKNDLFVRAAYQLHSKDVCNRIWARAKQMFPGHPSWNNEEQPE